MPNKKLPRFHGHYCKICGEYKANEKFSGRGHVNHICKTCAHLSAAEKAEQQTLTRLRNFHRCYRNAANKKWLENRIHDRRPAVASLAKEVYDEFFLTFNTENKKRRFLHYTEFSFLIFCDNLFFPSLLHIKNKAKK